MDKGQAPEEGWVENRATRGARALRPAELWSYRDLVAFLALRDLKVRYKQALFGGAWAVVQPLAGAAVFTVVFGRLAGLPSDGLPYLVFAYAGFCVWSYFQSAVNGARGSLLGNASLITKVYFPRLLAPLAAIVPGLVDLAVALLVLAGLIVWYGIAPTPALLAAPLFLLGAMVVAFGAGTLFATLAVEYRDVHQVFGLLIQLWFFLTPVAYPASLVDDGWRWVYYLNPMAGMIDGWRWAVIGRVFPGPVLFVSWLTGVAVLVVGLRVFQRAERRFADII